MNRKTKWFFITLIGVLLLSSIFSFVRARPAGPIISYVSNSTVVASSGNRSEDLKGTITTVTMSLNQQDYKWKAYVGNVTGSLALDNVNGKSIYDWALGTPTGEVYVTRASSVDWDVVSCVNETVIESEELAMGMTSTAQDSINSTFNYTNHKTFLVGSTLNMSGCRSTATYLNDTAQVMDPTAYFQEVLLKDNSTNSLIYSTMIENDQPGYTGSDNYDFQLLVAENDANVVPTLYFFYVELG